MAWWAAGRLLEGGSRMNKTELISEMASKADLSQAEAGRALDAFLETVTGALARGEEVAITGFGKFSVSERSARQGRNPQTGEVIQIATTRTPKFSAGAQLKKAAVAG